MVHFILIMLLLFMTLPPILPIHAAWSCTSIVRLIRQHEKPGKIPSLLHLYEGGLPWYPISFFTSWCWSAWCGCASCSIGRGQAIASQGIRSHPSLCRRVSAPATRSRFLVLPASPPVPPVSRPTTTYPSRPVARHPVSCPRGDGRARWRPLSTSAPMPPATIGVG